MNNIVIKGRLTKDPEMKVMQSGKNVVNFSVAVNRRFNRDIADFFDCVAWNKTADIIANHFVKGQGILLRGEMQQRQWQDKEGNNRYAWELLVDEVEFCEPKSSAPEKSQEPQSGNLDDFVPVEDADLPF